MIIQWFPGHMTKAFRLMEKEIKLVDAIIYVLDSRAPFSCVNPKFPSLIGDKPIIYVFNKSDLAEKTKLDAWINGYFKRENTRCIVLDSTTSGTGKKVETAILEVCKPKLEKFKLKGIKPTLRAMVIGVPNSGKSTLINNLCGKAKTVTGNKPGVTKGKQWVKIASGIELLDMPGTLWPAFDNTHVARHLAYIGSIREEVLDIPELALDFVGDIRKINKSILENRYSITIEENQSNLEVLEQICMSRKYLLRGGDFDYDRCCSAIISDFKQGKLGNITLDDFKDLKMLTKKDRKENKDV